jgi:HK97 gp10 family phage protein
MAIRNVVNPYPELTVTTVLKTDELTPALEEALVRALDTVADAVVKDAKERVPVKTGFLRSSIVVGTETGLTRTVHADASYAGLVEYGTRRQAAKPYFTPAVDQGKATLSEAVQAAFREAVGKIG